jgi:hypothetical protein
MNILRLKILMAVIISAVLNACSIIMVVDTAVDVALLPVKAGVAVVEAVIPDDD